MKKFLFLGLAIAVVFVSGCAKKPEQLATTYVSPMKYQNYDCDQIVMEMERVSTRTNQLYAQLNKNADKDKALMAVGILVAWPALLFLEGNGPEAAEYSQLKGEYQALQEAAIAKKCGQKLPPSPEEIIKAKDEESKNKK